MVNPARHFDIAIVGGGLNGAALALALKDSPYRVALIEPRPPQAPVDDDGWDARIFAFSPGNVAWLDGLGGWRDPVRAQPVHAMRITGDGGASLHFDGLDAGLGELAFIAENGRLQAALWQALPDNVSVVTAALDAVQWGASRHRLRLADGSEIEADLLVAADGADSWLRRQAGIALDVEDYHHVGVVANFACEKAHRGTAFQWFDGASVLAYLPLPGRRISVVWSSPSHVEIERVQRDTILVHH